MLIALLAASVIGVGTASAATVSGRVSSVDPHAHRLTLHHHVFHAPQAMKIGGIRKGEHVQITYHWSHGKRWITAYKNVTPKHTAAHMTKHPKTKAS